MTKIESARLLIRDRGECFTIPCMHCVIRNDNTIPCLSRDMAERVKLAEQYLLTHEQEALMELL